MIDHKKREEHTLHLFEIRRIGYAEYSIRLKHKVISEQAMAMLAMQAFRTLKHNIYNNHEERLKNRIIVKQ